MILICMLKASQSNASEFFRLLETFDFEAVCGQLYPQAGPHPGSANHERFKHKRVPHLWCFHVRPFLHIPSGQYRAGMSNWGTFRAKVLRRSAFTLI